MSDAKITLTTEAKNEGLEKLHTALAKGIQDVSSMKKELKDLEKVTKSGNQATQEQVARMLELRVAINKQKEENKALSREIGQTTAKLRAGIQAMADGDKGARALAGSFKLTTGFTTAFSVALGNLATKAVEAIAEVAGQVVNLGAQMQQSVAHLAAMTGGTQQATEAYRALNDAYRNTNFDETAVMNMGTQLMRMGYSAENAAGLIQLCADAATGLGTGQQGAQQLVDAISRMQAVGELTSKQMQQLKLSGVDMDAAFKSLGMTGEQAMKAVENGTLDTQQAISALTDYLHQYDGKMAESKDNTIDAWGDVTGNLQTFCAEIGAGIFDAFNQSEIVQELIDFTQSLVDMIRGEGCGAFSDLKAIASEVLNFIGGLLGFVLDTIKLIILILDDCYTAFKNFGSEVVEAIRPAVDMVLALYDAVKAVLSSIGKNFKEEVSRSWGRTYGPDPDDAGNQKVLGTGGNNFRQRSGGGVRSGGGGGGGGGSAKAALTEEEKALDSLIKKYKDADKQKKDLLKSSLELAKVNAGMMVGEAKALQEKKNKLEELKQSHNQLMEGYNNELKLANQIKDAKEREETIKRIREQKDAEEELYKAKVKAVEWDKNYADLQKESKSLIDTYFGEPEDWKAKVEKIKEETTKLLQEVDAAMAAPDEETQLSGMAQILRKTPEELAEDLAKKGESITAFAQNYREELLKTNAALAQNKSYVGQWHDWLKNYATDIGKSMGNAMTDWITGAKTASQAMKEFVQGLIKNAVQLLAQWLSIYAIFLLSGDPHLAAQAATKAVFGVDTGSGAKSAGSGITHTSTGWSQNIGGSIISNTPHHAMGGLIIGAGTSTSDSIPAMLSNGEYVIRSAAVDRIGVGTLDAINSGRVSHFAEGGSVNGTDEGIAAGNSVTINVSTMDATSFLGFLDRGGLDSIKQALFSDNRKFGSEVGVW